MAKRPLTSLIRAVVCHEGFAEQDELVVLGSPPFGVQCAVGAMSRKYVRIGKVADVAYANFILAAAARAHDLGQVHIDEIWLQRQIKNAAETTADHPLGTLLEVG